MQVEAVEKNKVKLTFEVGPERFEEGLKYSYNKNKGGFLIPGFRKGKAPRKIVEQQYGIEVLFNDAIDFVFGDAYDDAVKENKLEVVSKPEVSVESAAKDQGVVFSAEMFVKPEVTVSNYLGVTYAKADVTVTDEEIDAEIGVAREKNARILSVSDRPVELGDIATIDFTGFLDGEPFGGGSGTDYDLTIGSGQFIPGFEDQVVGRAVGDEFEINVVFPEEYHDKKMSGQAVVFQVKLKDIKTKEMPEVNDEFAQDVSEFDTLEEYRASVRGKLEQVKIGEAQLKKENEVLDTIIQNAVMDVPQVMIDKKAVQLLGEFEDRLRQQGMSAELYMQFTGQTKEDLINTYAEGAEKQVRGALAIEAAADNENITATEEEFEEEVGRMAESYKMDKEKLMNAISADEKKAIMNDIRIRKTLSLIMDSAVEQEA